MIHAFLQRMRCLVRAALHRLWRLFLWHSRLVTRLALAASAILLILVTLWQFWFIPRLETYRPVLVAELTRIAGLPVEVGSMQAGWDGVRPRLALLDVAVPGSDGQPALRFDRLEGALSWWALPLGQLHFSRLTLDSPAMQITRMREGQWRIGGMILADQPGNGGNSFLNWLLDQGSLIITRGVLDLQDEQAAGPRLTLTHLNVHASNLFGRRVVRFSVLPPQDIGPEIRGDGVLTGHDILRLADWKGRVQFDFPSVNLARLNQYLSAYVPDTFTRLPVLREGVGRLALTVNFADAHIRQLDAELGMDNLLLEQQSQRFALPKVDASVQWSAQRGNEQLLIRARHIEGASGLLTRNGRFEYSLTGTKHALRLQGFNLGGLSAYAAWLPGQWAARLANASLAGDVVDLRYGWQGNWQTPEHWQGEAEVQGLDLVVPASLQHLGKLDIKTKFDDKTGMATLSSRTFRLNWPAQFVEPLTLTRADAALSWSRMDKGWEVEVSRLALANAETAVDVSAVYRWQGEGLGHLDLKGDITQLPANRVYAYLPRVAGDDTLTWLKTSLLSGRAFNGKAIVQGELEHFPFADGSPGLFRITTDARDVTLSYADDWPSIQSINGSLLFEGYGMTIQAPTARIFDVQLKNIVTRIPDLSEQQHVLVDGKAEGQTSGFLHFVRASPVRESTQGFLDELQSAGSGTLDLKLDIPIDDTDASKVSGRYRFGGNRLDFGGSIPVLTQAGGTVDFTESSLTIRDASARSLGGQVRLNGMNDSAGNLKLEMRGEAQLGEATQRYVPQHVRRMSGVAAYQGELLARRGRYEFSLQSPLALARIDLPAPLGKPAGEARPLRLRISGDPQQSSVEFAYGRLLQAALQQQGEQPYSGQIMLGAAATPVATASPRGIQVRGRWPELDLTAWMGLMEGDAGQKAAISFVDVGFDRLSGWGRRLSDVQIKAAPSPQGWSAQLASKEAAGTLVWREGERAGLSGRLAYLHLPLPTLPAAANGSAVASKQEKSTQAKPALDLVVDDFRYKASELGQLVVNARPSGDGWQLNQVSLNNPDGKVSMTGFWLGSGPAERTTAKIRIESENTGKLLARMGYPDAVRRAPALLTGEGSWQGAPFAPALDTVQGKLQLNVDAGQFAKIEPGAGRLLSVLSLQALPRRIKLDFRDVFSEGLEFDSIKGDAVIEKGIVRTDNLAIDGPAAKIRFKGETNLSAGTQNLRVRIAPLVGDMASLAVGVVNPIAGVAAFALQRLLKDPLGQLVSYEYQITGDMLDPQVRKVSGDNP